jgi:hypothetical protein
MEVNIHYLKDNDKEGNELAVLPSGSTLPMQVFFI